MCDFCMVPKKKEEIVGFRNTEGRIDQMEINESKQHICFKCAKRLSEFAESALKKKIVGK